MHPITQQIRARCLNTWAQAGARGTLPIHAEVHAPLAALLIARRELGTPPGRDLVLFGVTVRAPVRP